MSKRNFPRPANPVNPLEPIKLRLRHKIERMGINAAMDAGVDLPDEDDDLLTYGIGWHCRWLEDNAKHGEERKQIIALGRLFRLYPSEVRGIVSALQHNGIADDEPVQYAMAELIFRCLAEMPEYKGGVEHLHALVHGEGADA